MKRLLVMLTLVGIMASCAPTTPYAAIVNGTVISAATIDSDIHAVLSSPKYARALDASLQQGSSIGGLRPGGSNTVNAEYAAQVVYSHVLVELLREEMRRTGTVVTDADRAAAEQAMRAQQDPTIIDSLASNYRNYLIETRADLAVLLAKTDTPEAERAYYDANQAKFTQYCVSHILVETKAQADDIYKRIQNGGDYAAIAKAESIDNQSAQSSANQGGSLGCIDGTQLDNIVPEFRDAMLTLKSGEVSQPVRSAYGYHVIKLTSRTQQSFDQARTTIASKLGDQSALFDGLLAKAKVKVNPRYGDFHPADPASGQSAQITPHDSTALEPPSSTPTDGQGIPPGVAQISGE